MWTTVSDIAYLSLWLFQKPVKALPVSGLYWLVVFMWRRTFNKVLPISLLLLDICLFLGITYSAFLFCSFFSLCQLVTSFSFWLLCEKAHLFWTLLFSPFLCGDLVTVTNLSLSAQITFKSLSISYDVTPQKRIKWISLLPPTVFLLRFRIQGYLYMWYPESHGFLMFIPIYRNQCLCFGEKLILNGT